MTRDPDEDVFLGHMPLPDGGWAGDEPEPAVPVARVDISATDRCVAGGC